MSISKLNSSLMMKEISFMEWKTQLAQGRSLSVSRKLLKVKKSTGMNRLFSQRSMELSFPWVFEKL
jgi:hypothetical protein